MTTHPLETIQKEGQTQITSPEQLRTGLISNAAGELFGVFAKGAGNQRTKTVYAMYAKGFTPAEYKMVEAKAIELAADADRLSGWKPATGAKGRGKYGPKELTMRTKSYERMAIFGAMRLNLAAIVSVPADGGVFNEDTLPTFDLALAKAKEYLRSANLNWEGTGKAKLTGTIRVQKLLQSSIQQSTEQAIAKNPRLLKGDPGADGKPVEKDETMPEYWARLGQIVEQDSTVQLDANENKFADEAAAKIMTEYGVAMAQRIADKISAAIAHPVNMSAPASEPQAPSEGTDSVPAKAPASDDKTEEKAAQSDMAQAMAHQND